MRSGVGIAFRLGPQVNADAYSHSYSCADDHACTYVHADGDTYSLAATLSYPYDHATAPTLPYINAHTHAISNTHTDREPHTNHHSSTYTHCPKAYADARAYTHSYAHRIPVPVPTSPHRQEHGPAATSHPHANPNASTYPPFVSQSYFPAVSHADPNAYAHANPRCSASNDGP